MLDIAIRVVIVIGIACLQGFFMRKQEKPSVPEDDLLPEQIMNEVGDSGNGNGSDSSSNGGSDNNDNSGERESEVFNLSENKYTYDDAKLACKS